MGFNEAFKELMLYDELKLQSVLLLPHLLTVLCISTLPLPIMYHFPDFPFREFGGVSENQMFLNSTRSLTHCLDLQTSKTLTVVKRLVLPAIYCIVVSI